MENLENNNQEENKNNENKTTTKVEIDYEKLSNIINKGKEVKENGILKNFFIEQGLKEEEVKEAIATYKQNVKKQEELNKNKDVELETKLTETQKELRQERFNNSLTSIGHELGLDSKSLKAVQKLSEIDEKEIFDEKGKVNQEKLKEAINKTLEEYPQFLKKEEKKLEGFKFGVSDTSKTDVTKNNSNPFKFNF